MTLSYYLLVCDWQKDGKFLFEVGTRDEQIIQSSKMEKRFKRIEISGPEGLGTDLTTD